MSLKIVDVEGAVEKIIEDQKGRTEELVKRLEKIINQDKQLIGLLTWLKAHYESLEEIKKPAS